ncbi:MAG: nucleotidyltransferase domain-containing protein [Candidatus Woesearchaeota archaeon]
MKTEIKIIKLFIADRKPKTIREISKAIGSDYRITYIAVQKLLEKNILSAKTVGKSSLCSLNPAYFGFEIFKAEEERKNAALNNRNLSQLYKEIMAKAGTSFFVLLLFGSYAKQKQTKSSDIDLMFICDDKNFEKRIIESLYLLPLKTHSLAFTEQEFRKMKDSKESNVVKETIQNNIILNGSEAYYRMING